MNKIKLQIRWMKLEARESLIDFWLFAWPVFVATGFITASFRFWYWLLF